MRKHTGQGMTEYSLISVLVLCLGLSALPLLGKNLNVSIQGTVDTLQKPQKQGLEVISTGGNSRIKPPDVLIPKSAQLTTNGIDLSSYQSLAKEIQTAGANGTTEIMADRIEVLAHEKLAQGEITQAQYNQLVALANQGHRLGALNKLAEEFVANASPGTNFKDQTVIFDGKRYTLSEFTSLFGFHQPYEEGMLTSPLDAGKFANTEMSTFIRFYDQAVANGALADPATQVEVKKLSADIASINDSVLFALDDLAFEAKIQPQEFTTSIVSRIAGMDAPQSTNQKSAVICNFGHGQDTTGIHCTTN